VTTTQRAARTPQPSTRVVTGPGAAGGSRGSFRTKGRNAPATVRDSAPASTPAPPPLTAGGDD
jgi:hypothetical protein